MIKITNIKVYNIENAIRGMRNPMNSWNMSDSFSEYIGENDLQLAKKLVLAGTDHSKFMRQIFVSMDILSPFYWWKEMDTYKVSTVSNSTSTMHKISSTPITVDLFSVDHIKYDSFHIFESYCNELEKLRQEYNLTKNKSDWYTLIQMLPSSFNQLRTWTANYQVLRNIYHSRNQHKLEEWKNFCTIIANELPYNELIIMKEG